MVVGSITHNGYGYAKFSDYESEQIKRNKSMNEATHLNNLRTAKLRIAVVMCRSFLNLIYETR